MSMFSGRLTVLLFMAWRNIWRNRLRSMLTIAAIAGSLILVILYSALLEGMTRQMVRFATEISSGHLQVHRQAFVNDQDLYATLPWSTLGELEQAFPEHQFAPRLYASGLASSGNNSGGVMIRAVDPERERATSAMLNHVRSGTANLDQVVTGTDGLSRHALLLGAQLAKNMQLQPGSEVILVTQAVDGSIGNALYQVAGILKPLQPDFDRMGVLMSITAYQDLMALENGFHELTVRLHDLDQLDAQQTTLGARLAALEPEILAGEPDGKVLLRNWKQLAPTVAEMLALSQSMVLVIGVIVISLASLGLVNTLLMSVHERKHELGILLALGMKGRWLMLMVLLESLFLALVSVLLGAVLGSAIALYLGQRGIDFSGSLPDGFDWAGITFEPVMELFLKPSHLLLACMLILLVTLLAALIPSWRTARLKPVEVMR